MSRNNKAQEKLKENIGRMTLAVQTSNKCNSGG